ncbi:MAG: hypothetical protein ACJAU0_001699 [Flavobacteriales bacterium]|jgi:hypothetical protein
MFDGANHRDDLFSKAVRAGKRTYFFDVKSTKGNDLYLTITESKRRFSDDGVSQYEKHKLFLYKEDFDKFADGLQETVDRIRAILESDGYDDDATNRIAETTEAEAPTEQDEKVKEFTDVSFDELDD